MDTKLTYIQNLINEEILKLIPEAKFSMGKGSNVQPTDDDADDGFDVEDIFGFGGDNADPSTLRQNVDFSKQPKTGFGGQGDAFQASKNAAYSALDRAKGNLPYSQPALDKFFTDPNVKSKANRYNRDTKNPNALGRIQVSFSHGPENSKAYPGGPFSVITLFNIEPKDVMEIAKRFNQQGYTQKVNIAAKRVNYGKDGVTFIVYDRDLDKWKEEDLPELMNYLGSRVDDKGKPLYGDQKILDDLQTTIERKIYTDRDVDNYFHAAEQGNLERYKNYLESEDDEEINAIIALYQRGGLMDMVCKKLNIPKSFGHILSWRNAKAIIGSGRNATFVLPEEAWRLVFGRVVKPNAQPFFVRIPNARNKKGKWKNPTDIYFPYVDDQGKSQRVRLTCTEDILQTFFGGKPYDTLSPQQQYFVNCLANSENVKSYFALQEYDVADTVWDPSLNPVDVFTQTVGLENNLNGGLNQAARDEMERRQTELDAEEPEDETNIQQDAPENTDARFANMINMTNEAYKNVKNYADMEGISYHATTNDVSLSLVNALLTIAKNKFPETQGLTNPRLYNELAENAVYFICRMYGIALDRINSFRHAVKVNTDDLAKFDAVVDLLVDIVEGVKVKKQGDISKIALEEGAITTPLKTWTQNRELLHKKLRQFLTKLNSEAQTGELYEMLNRMENSKKNLL